MKGYLVLLGEISLFLFVCICEYGCPCLLLFASPVYFSPPFSRLSCFRITNLVILKQDKRLKGGGNISDWRTPNFLKALFGCRTKTLKCCSYLFHFLQVLDEIQDNGIKIYTFPDCDSEDDEEFVQINQELKVWFTHFC